MKPPTTFQTSRIRVTHRSLYLDSNQFDAEFDARLALEANR